MSLPLEEWRRMLEWMAKANSGVRVSWQIDCELGVLRAVSDHLPPLLDELAELRAYRAATEAALEALSLHCVGEGADEYADAETLSILGLLRDPKAGEGGVA